jgi:hypothetical protein
MCKANVQAFFSLPFKQKKDWGPTKERKVASCGASDVQANVQPFFSLPFKQKKDWGPTIERKFAINEVKAEKRSESGKTK